VTQRLNIDRFYALFLADPAAPSVSVLDLGNIAQETGKTPADSLPTKAFLQIVRDPLNDPNTGVVHWLPPSPIRAIAVGAAGNGITIPTPDGMHGRHVALPFPFAPAMWSDVISIGASIKDSEKPTAYTNRSEVILPGSFDLTTDQVYHLEGTSFAAPRMAAKQAIYLLTGGTIPCNADTPPLGYATEAVLNSSNWRDNWQGHDYRSAVTRCALFETRTLLQGPTP
jgi:hypothetical protein